MRLRLVAALPLLLTLLFLLAGCGKEVVKDMRANSPACNSVAGKPHLLVLEDATNRRRNVCVDYETFKRQNMGRTYQP